jgi:Zinc finger, C3HC4 type (RING finger)
VQKLLESGFVFLIMVISCMALGSWLLALGSWLLASCVYCKNPDLISPAIQGYFSTENFPPAYGISGFLPLKQRNWRGDYFLFSEGGIFRENSATKGQLSVGLRSLQGRNGVLGGAFCLASYHTAVSSGLGFNTMGVNVHFLNPTWECHYNFAWPLGEREYRKKVREQDYMRFHVRGNRLNILHLHCDESFQVETTVVRQHDMRLFYNLRNLKLGGLVYLLNSQTDTFLGFGLQTNYLIKDNINCGLQFSFDKLLGSKVLLGVQIAFSFTRQAVSTVSEFDRLFAKNTERPTSIIIHSENRQNRRVVNQQLEQELHLPIQPEWLRDGFREEASFSQVDFQRIKREVERRLERGEVLDDIVGNLPQDSGRLVATLAATHAYYNNPNDLKYKYQCVVCLEGRAIGNLRILPCNSKHLLCDVCALQMPFNPRRCPQCRAPYGAAQCFFPVNLN